MNPLYNICSPVGTFIVPFTGAVWLIWLCCDIPCLIGFLDYPCHCHPLSQLSPANQFVLKVTRQFEFTPKTSTHKLWLDWFCNRSVILCSRGLLLLHSMSPLSSSIMVYEEHWCYYCSIVTETSLKFIKFSWLLLWDEAYYMLFALLFQIPGCWNYAVSFCLLRFSLVCLPYSLLLKGFFFCLLERILLLFCSGFPLAVDSDCPCICIIITSHYVLSNFSKLSF